jgi:epsilon-lactone hydrolase
MPRPEKTITARPCCRRKRVLATLLVPEVGQLRRTHSTVRPTGCSGSLVFYCVATATILMPSQAVTMEAPRLDENGTIHVPAFDLPESSFLSPETRAVLKQSRESQAKSYATEKSCPSMEGAKRADMPEIRRCQADAFYQTALYKGMLDRYPVVVAVQSIGGVYTEVFTPKEGVAQSNNQRVLINVHGGGFWEGSRTFSRLESIPIASVGRIKVISIDYRMAPEYTFPAASEDVAAVYRELLKIYRPEGIGLYGCSAGGELTAHAMAWFQKAKLPLPGAIGMFCKGAESVDDSDTSRWMRSDGAYIAGALSGKNFERAAEVDPYYKGVDRRTELASPGDYDYIMAKFPPSLLISSTRDFLLSSVIVTHAQLSRLGVDAELHVWEGLGHAFLFDPSLPESREAYSTIVRFFDRHLFPCGPIRTSPATLPKVPGGPLCPRTAP